MTRRCAVDIFPLLFFKRISDVFDEEFEQALQESGGDRQFADFPENHRFQIPDGCHWNDVRARTSNVGQALQRAFRGIEKANPATLYGIFGDTQWSNKERLSDELLCDLVEHFSSLPLSNGSVDSDILGQAYEYLIKKFADQTNRKAGEFYTPRSVVRLMVNTREAVGPLRTQHLRRAAPGPGRLRVPTAHRDQLASENGPVRHPVSAWRPVPR